MGLEGTSPPLKIDARVEQGSIAAVLSALQIQTPAEGNFKSEAHLGGTMTHPIGNATFSASDLSFYGEPLGTLTVEIRVDGQRVETTRFLLEKTPGDATEDSLQGKGEYDIGSGRFSFEAAGKDLKIETLKLPDETPVNGKVNLSASGTGTFDSPSVDLKLQATDVEIREQLVGTLDATAALRNQQALIEVRAPRLNLSSNARIETRAPYPTEFELKASDSDLSLLAVPDWSRADAGRKHRRNHQRLGKPGLDQTSRAVGRDPQNPACRARSRGSEPGSNQACLSRWHTQNRSCNYRFKQRRDRNSRSRTARGASWAWVSDRQRLFGPGRSVSLH